MPRHSPLSQQRQFSITAQRNDENPRWDPAGSPPGRSLDFPALYLISVDIRFSTMETMMTRRLFIVMPIKNKSRLKMIGARPGCPSDETVGRENQIVLLPRLCSLFVYDFICCFCLHRFCSSHWRRAASRFLLYDVDVFYVFFDWLCFVILRMRFHSSAPLKILYCVSNS